MPDTSERGRLRHFLDAQRHSVLEIVEGLDEAQLHTAVLPSGWTPPRLLRHLIGAEAMWFQWVVLGREPQVRWEDGVEDPPRRSGAAFATAHSSAAVIEQYRRQCAISDEEVLSPTTSTPHSQASAASIGRTSRSPTSAGWPCT